MRIMCRSKIHRATVTEANLNYMGSITIDEELMERADILPYEKVQIVNLDNGARSETYALPGKRKSRVICPNGGSARLAFPGDKIIIMAYSVVEENEMENFKPRVLFLDEKNMIVEGVFEEEPLAIFT